MNFININIRIIKVIIDNHLTSLTARQLDEYFLNFYESTYNKDIFHNIRLLLETH